MAKHAAPTTASTQTPDQEVCQKIAEALWAAATSDTGEIARYDLPVYSGLRSALHEAIKIAYTVDDEVVTEVDDIFAELGPLDGVDGIPGTGIHNFVSAALAQLHEAEITAILELLH